MTLDLDVDLTNKTIDTPSTRPNVRQLTQRQNCDTRIRVALKYMEDFQVGTFNNIVLVHYIVTLS